MAYFVISKLNLTLVNLLKGFES